MTVPVSKNTAKFVQLLYTHGYITSYKVLGFKIHLTLSVFESAFVLKNLKLSSKKGYRSTNQIPSIWRSGNNVKEGVFSTSKQLLTRCEALKFRCGGESLCEIL